MRILVVVCGAFLLGQVAGGGVERSMEANRAPEVIAPGVIAHFAVTGRSRLAAMALLGARARVSLLVEAGDLGFLEAPVTVSMDRFTVDEGMTKILAGEEEYGTERRGALVVVAPRRPKQAMNRLLGLRLGKVVFEGKEMAMLNPYLGSLIRAATGCPGTGYAWVGLPLDLDIPRFVLTEGTFSGVVEEVAKAPEPTMWVVKPDDGGRGCMNDATNQWEVGFYAYSEGLGEMPFRQSVGPMMVR